MAENTKKSREIFIMVTNACNLQCTYCYETVKNEQVISVEKAKDILRNELSKIAPSDQFYVIFHGGEPFLAFNAMKEISEWLWKSYASHAAICMTTTNGTVISSETKTWLMKNNKRFIPILSIDGTRASHNTNRPNSYNNIDKDFFKENWPNQPVKMTISPATLPYLFENFMAIHTAGFIVNPSLAKEVSWDEQKDYMLFAMEMKKLAAFYLEHPAEVPCELINIALENFAPEVNVPFNRACGAGDNVIAYDVNGHAFPCHAFFGDPHASYNKEQMDELFSLLQKNDGLMLSNDCDNCLIYSCCSPCYGLNFTNRNDPGKFDTAMCKFNHIRVLAAADMFSRMLTSSTEYKVLKDKIPQERILLLSGIKEVFNNTSMNISL